MSRCVGPYRFQALIGIGGTARVWRAIDERSGEPVAVKVFPADGARLQRRERLVLRMLRLPGVVRIRDEGVEGGLAWIAMDLVRGAPFPGRDASVRDVFAAALATLVEVHDLGVCHGDLKPGNVLVEGDRAVLLDFGFASVGPGELVGSSARWAAPEVLVGRAPGPASDVFSLAAMAAEALGAWRDVQPADLVEQRVLRPGADLSACETHDPELLELLAGCLAREPSARPSALRAFLALRPAPEMPAVRDEDDLRSVIAGPDEVLHLRRDGARLLWQRSGGDPGRMRLELGRWAAAGARWQAGRLHVTRAQLDRLLARDMVAALPPFEDVDAWTGRARQLDCAGGGETALELLQAWLDWGAARGQPRCRPVLAALAEIAVRTERLPLIDRALAQVERAGEPALEALLAAARCASTGDVAGAERLLAGCDAAGGARGALAARLIALGATAPELDAWSRRAPGARANALGLVAYRGGRFEEALQRFLEAARSTDRASATLAARCNGAACALDTGRFAEARELAAEAAELADRCRLPAYELRAVSLGRCAAHRAGAPLTASRRYVDLARELEGAELQGFCALTEAAIAWRAGERALCTELAAIAATSYASFGAGPQALLASALVASGSGPDPRLIEAARACPLPGIALQVLALLRARVTAAEVAALTGGLRGGLAQVREVLSVAECLARLEVSEISDTSASEGAPAGDTSGA